MDNAELFQSTLPARGATSKPAHPLGSSMYFNPRSPHGERLFTAALDILNRIFQSTLPARGATFLRNGRGFPATLFQSTLPARGATPRVCIRFQPCAFQSTLPARGATRRQKLDDLPPPISIHAPRTGSDLRSTGGTVRTWWISIHAPRTGSDRAERSQRQHSSISIHAPRTGSDTRILIQLLQHNRFQSTLPARGATCFSLLRTPGPAHFNPRSPHGERLDRYEGVPHYYTFQSTLPARGATTSSPASCCRRCHFNPRSPHGERH